MTVNQISVFMENKPGTLVEIISVLAQHKIDLRALSVADTKEFGILRLIVGDAANTERVLRDAGMVVTVTPVLAVALADQPGSLAPVLKILNDEGISLEYAYAFTARCANSAYMIFRVADNDRAVSALTTHGVKLASQSELDQL